MTEIKEDVKLAPKCWNWLSIMLAVIAVAQSFLIVIQTGFLDEARKQQSDVVEQPVANSATENHPEKPFIVPSQADAEKWWLDDFAIIIRKTQDESLINDAVKRRAYIQTLHELRDRTEKLFGNDRLGKYRDCINAPDAVITYWSNVHHIMLHPNDNTASDIKQIIYWSWSGGESYIGCINLIKQLE